MKRNPLFKNIAQLKYAKYDGDLYFRLRSGFYKSLYSGFYKSLYNNRFPKFAILDENSKDMFNPNLFPIKIICRLERI